jgi:energy-coupling factor transport system substrate-specific component
VCWGVIAPLGDIWIYSQPAGKVFLQGIVATLTNSIAIGVVATLLLIAYGKTQTQNKKLTKE